VSEHKTKADLHSGTDDDDDEDGGGGGGVFHEELDIAMP
jgi:hypothetical protein